MSTMTETIRSTAPDMTPVKEKLVRLLKRLALFLPAVIIFALIALYYIQLSHMGPM